MVHVSLVSLLLAYAQNPYVGMWVTIDGTFARNCYPMGATTKRVGLARARIRDDTNSTTVE